MQDILESRENRVDLQEDLRSKYNMPIMAMRVNYPGINKNNETTKNIMEIMFKIVKDLFRGDIYYTYNSFTGEGPISILVIDKPAREIKKIAIEIECKHTLGRCMDLDVYTKDGNAISRSDLDVQSRKCYLCEEDAQVCVRSQKHSISEVIDYINEKHKEYMENMYGN